MRILDVTEFYSPRGGVRAQLTQKGRGLRALGHDHLVVAPGVTNEERPLDANVEASACGSAQVSLVEGPTLPYDSNYQLLWRVGRVQEILRSYQPDLISVNSLYLAALAIGTLPERARYACVATWHSNFIESYVKGVLQKALPKAVANQITELLWRLVRRVLNQHVATFVASRDQANVLKTRGVERVVEIPYGVERSVFRPEARDKDLRRQWCGDDPNAVVAVAVGRLSREKEWELILDAVGRVRTERHLHLLIFGDGPEASHLKALAPPGRVSFMGFEPDRHRLATAIASADFLVHANMNETYCFSVAEAIACGLPVVVPDGGAVLDLIDGCPAFVFCANSPSACATAMERAVAAAGESQRLRALAVSRNIPDCNAQVLKVASVYQELIFEHRAAQKRTGAHSS